MTRMELDAVAEQVARGLSHARVAGGSAFVTTSVMYANGTVAVVRIDEAQDGYFVSDNGVGALTADMMGALPTFSKMAGPVAQRFGIEFDHRAFFVMKVAGAQLVGAAMTIANASAHAIEQTFYALDQAKTKRSRAVFEDRLRSAFGTNVRFGASLTGASRQWDVDGLVLRPDGSRSVFEFVSPAFSAVAATHMKFSDIRHGNSEAHTTAVLADYAKTDPSLRAVLSSASEHVIAADEPPEIYQQAA